MAQLAPMMQLRARFEDKCGHPLAGGNVFAFEAGTSTPKDTYADAAGTIPNTHPIKLDYRGEADIFLLTGRYRFVVYSCTGTKIYDVDDVGEWLGKVSADNVYDGEKTQHQINSEQAEKNLELAQLVEDTVDTERERAVAAEGTLSQSIITETNRAIAAEGVLQTNINTESSRAIAAEAVIEGKVNAIGTGNKAYLTYAAMDADKANIPNNSKVTVTNDSDNTKNGDWQYSTSGGGTFTKSAYDPLTLAKADATTKANAAEANAKAYTDTFDSLKLNKGKVYPFKSLSRNGVTSNPSTSWNNLILDVRVNNAEAGKYYQIAYQQNGATINGKSEYNWIIYEFDIATYNTAAVPVLLVNYTDAGQPQLVKNGTIQTVNIKSLVKPKVSFTITCDTSGLPAGTSPINSTAQGSDSWSFVIDQSRYIYEDLNALSKTDVPRDWLVNQGQYYPFVSANYKGVTSPASTLFLDIFKDFQVENAEEGYVYQLAYYTNGSTATGSDRQERWIINKRLESNYTDPAATETQIVALTTIQPTLPKTGKVETIVLQSTENEKFRVTVDTSKLPTYGNYISSVAGQNGYSWYLTKNNYVYNSKRSNRAYFQWDATTKLMKYRYVTRQLTYEWTFGPNGANSLPNFKEIKATNGTNILTNNLATVTAFSTDWLPPLVFYVVNNPDDNNISSFTGGNHASNGDATGDPTATNDLFAIFIDGQELDMAKNFSCFCDQVDVKIVNRIMASNTKLISKRYAIKQIFDVSFTGQNVGVHCKLRALEDIRLRSDYGPQLTTDGFRSTQLILDGQTVDRVPYDNNANSGPRSLYPNANALILKGSSGILASWIDRTYGNGTPENCAPDQPLIRGGTSTNHKFYHCAFRSMLSDETVFPPLLLTPSDKSYKWRGGYVMKTNDPITNFDSVLELKEMTSVINAVEYY